MITLQFENAAGKKVGLKTDIIDHSSTNWNFTIMQFVLPENNGTTVTNRTEAEALLNQNKADLGLALLTNETYNLADMRALAEVNHLKITKFPVGAGSPVTIIDCTDWSCSLSLEE